MRATRLIAVGLLLAAGLLLLGASAPAKAKPPERVRFDENFTVDLPAGEFCDFPVRYESRGTFAYTFHYARDANLPWGATRHADFTETLTNLVTGASDTWTPVRAGNERFGDPLVAEDGSVTYIDVFHGAYVVARLGHERYVAAGKWASFFTFDADGSLLSKGFAEEPSLWPGFLSYVAECAAVA